MKVLLILLLFLMACSSSNIRKTKNQSYVTIVQVNFCFIDRGIFKNKKCEVELSDGNLTFVRYPVKIGQHLSIFPNGEYSELSF